MAKRPRRRDGCGQAAAAVDFRIGREPLLLDMHDQHRDPAVIERVVTDAAEQRGAQRTAAAGAHHEQVVARGLELFGERRADRVVGQDLGHRDRVRNPADGVTEDRGRLALELFAERHGSHRRARGVGPRRRVRDRREDRQPTIAAERDIDRLIKRLVRVRRAIDGHEDVAKHDDSNTRETHPGERPGGVEI